MILDLQRGKLLHFVLKLSFKAKNKTKTFDLIILLSTDLQELIYRLKKCKKKGSDTTWPNVRSELCRVQMCEHRNTIYTFMQNNQTFGHRFVRYYYFFILFFTFLSHACESASNAALRCVTSPSPSAGRCLKLKIYITYNPFSSLLRSPSGSMGLSGRF